MYEVGQCVVYKTAGVCKIVGYEQKNVSGKMLDYCRLVPVFSDNSTFYIPVKTLSNMVRPLLKKEEIEKLIEIMPDTELLDVEDSKRRKMLFAEILKSGDYGKLIAMMKLLHNEQVKRADVVKSLNLFDEKTMRDAENIMCQEFAISLGIEYKDVMEYIKSKIENG